MIAWFIQLHGWQEALRVLYAPKNISDLATRVEGLVNRAF